MYMHWTTCINGSQCLFSSHMVICELIQYIFCVILLFYCDDSRCADQYLT